MLPRLAQTQAFLAIRYLLRFAVAALRTYIIILKSLVSYNCFYLNLEISRSLGSFGIKSIKHSFIEMVVGSNPVNQAHQWIFYAKHLQALYQYS